MPLSLKTAPTTYPVELTEAKDHLRYTATALNAHVTSLIKIATEQVEKDTKRALMPQVWEDVRGSFPAGAELVFERPPLVSIVSIKYYDSDNALQDLASSIYELDIKSLKGKLVLAYGQSWPATYPRSDAVTITYNAGYTASAPVNPLPESLKMAVLLNLGLLWDKRKAEAPDVELYNRFVRGYKVVEELRA